MAGQMARKRSNRRRAKGGRASPWKAILTWVAAAMLAVGAGTGYMLLQKPSVNPDTMCLETGAKGVTVMLLDVSDPLTFSQDAKLRRLISSSNHNLVEKHHRLDIYQLPEQGQKANRLFSMCNPGNMSDASTAEKLGQNTILFQLKWREFTEQLDRSLSSLTETSGNQTSPIFEAIDFITAASFPQAEVTLLHPENYKLVIVSDMLQNSSKLSVFQGNQISEESKLNTAFYFGGQTIVKQLLSEKYDSKQTNNLVSFWESNFARAGSQLVGWEKW